VRIADREGYRSHTPADLANYSMSTLPVPTHVCGENLLPQSHESQHNTRRRHVQWNISDQIEPDIIIYIYNIYTPIQQYPTESYNNVLLAN